MDPAKLKVVELRAQLSQRGLDTKGKKEVLVERLRMALDEENASRDQGKVDADVENVQDSTVKENSEKVVEPARSVQPPKTPGRASRSSSMTTPTKISTRSGPRTSTTPNSMRQPSPIKAQRTETACDVLPTISESIPEEKEVKEPPIVRTPEKTEEKQTREQLKDTQNEVLESPTKLEDKLSNSSEEEAAHVVTNVSEVTETDLPETMESVSEAQEESKDENKEEEAVQESVVEKETVEDQQSEKENNENSNTEQSQPNDNQEEEQISEITDDKPEVKETVEDTDENTEMECNVEELKQDSESVNMDASEDNSKNEPLSDSVQEPDVKMNTSNIDDKVETQAEESIEDKSTESTEAKHMLDETENNSNKEEEEQDVEMAEEVSEKIKEEEEESKADTQEDKEDKEPNDCSDRKRKRSPSPAEDHEISEAPVAIEDEPEIDESALILSWYDSDLNLVIDKDGFFTATPMHGDDFAQMWAGARASYGFLNGKVYYEAKLVEHCPVNAPDDKNPHMLRIGWSASHTSMQLGEEKLSYGYDNSGKKSTNNEFEDYGPEFDKNDIIGCYLDATSEDVVILSYTLNGKDLGMAFTVSKEDLDGKPLFPHILSKNCSVACNFGQEDAWSEEILPDYVSIGNVDSEYKVPGPRRLEKKEDCEVIMMCGLPASGKTAWASKYVTENPQKLYNVLGIDNLIKKMKHMGLPCKEHHSGSWDMLIEKCRRALNKLMELAATRRRNYILDQTNVYPSAQRRKMKNFYGYQRKAVVIVPTEEEFKSRATKHNPIEGKEVADSELMEMKANFSAPVVGEYFDAVDWIELNEEEGKKLIEKYNKEGKQAGFGDQQAAKRQRTDRFDVNKEGTRDARNNRDNHRRNNYQNRNRNPMWRGGGNMGWRDRQRGGHIRHGSAYGLPAMPWRGRAPIPPPHRGMDRRGIADRRSMNDRTRATGPRQGGWGSMSGYQGSQQGVWVGQGNWSGGQSGGRWGQQGDWEQQQWGSWKGYGQGSYGQTNYNQQGYGNGNWNSWNQQYYNQYWGQQQQTGQTTAAGGGQAACTTENVTTDSSSDLATDYSYPQE